MTFLAWLVTVIPVIGPPVSAFLILIIQSYYSGFSLIDYTLERKRYTVGESIAFAKRNRSRVTGVGMGFILIMFVPVIGWFAAPGFGVVAATLSSLEIIEE